MGEGEETTVRLVNMLKTNRKDFVSLDGFAYRENNEVKVNSKRRYIENLDMIPFPAYNLIDLTDYYVDTSKWHNPKNLPINTSILLSPAAAALTCVIFVRCTWLWALNGDRELPLMLWMRLNFSITPITICISPSWTTI